MSLPAPVSVPDAPAARQTVLGTLRSPRLLKTEVLAGLVVALALIPEAIAFSVIAGVDPRMGLFASFTMAVTIAFVGGRPAMISAATGAVALVIAPVVAKYGVDYLLPTVILAGVLQILLALAGVAKLMRCEFMDAGPYCEISKMDAVHMTKEDHLALAEAVCEKVRSII